MPDALHLQCLVVDDEPPAREVLKRYIQEVPMLQLAGECGNALQAIQFLQTQHVDILFLDIRMPQLNGTELLKVIRNPPPVIFTTAHAEYALEGYELDVMDYLLKPVRFDRFVKAVNKVAQLSGQRAIETNNLGDDAFQIEGLVLAALCKRNPKEVVIGTIDAHRQRTEARTAEHVIDA